MFVKDTH